MQRTRTTQSFLSMVVAELGTISRPALIGFAGIGALSALCDLVYWPHRPRLTPWDYSSFALLVGASLVATYGACMEMAGHRRSWSGLIRFLATLLVMAAPLLVAIALVALSPSDQRVLAGAIACLGLGLFFLSFLPGWPLLQATSPALVGPWAAFKATKGLRWQLFLVSTLTSSVNRFVPKVSTGEDLASAGLLAALGGVVTAFSLMLAAAIAVSAWRHMTARRLELA